MMSQILQLSTRQVSKFSCHASFVAAFLFVAISTVTSEAPKTVYDAAKAVKEREAWLNQVCDKYDDELKYEYKALHAVPKEKIFQTATAEPKDADHINQIYGCANGAWDKNYIRGVLRRSFYLNRRHNDTEWNKQWKKIAERDDKNEHLKSYRRIILAENPFLRFVDYYHHYYVNAPRSGEHHTGDIVKYFLNNRNDKISKDIKANKDGEKYFEVSDLEEGVLTFRQFINYITKTTSETLQGKKLVSDYQGFTGRWEPMWKRCTPCIKDYRFQYVVDMEHVDEDMDYIMHKELNIHNKTDGTPLKLYPYWDPEGFEFWRNNYPNWAYDGYAMNNMAVVEKFYSTLTKSEIRELYEKYRLDFELFGFKPDKYLDFGMSDETSPSYDP